MIKQMISKIVLTGAAIGVFMGPAIQVNAKTVKREAAAKAWIGRHESHGNYHAHNGKYYGKWQLDVKYLTHGKSKHAQSKAADRYVKIRYGSWHNAENHWKHYGWY